ncbi:hypothetical protein AB184_30055 [Klebsiella oxytoca]|nr:hypothetical protein AB184_30055 [Klebsiella oxytoca]AKL26198.1 hypothetical protein AB181_30370 [Klebsiella oxytoca]APB44307.1 hypothetical protein AGF18_10390 [Klebsiella oxytoca]
MPGVPVQLLQQLPLAVRQVTGFRLAENLLDQVVAALAGLLNAAAMNRQPDGGNNPQKKASQRQLFADGHDAHAGHQGGCCKRKIFVNTIQSHSHNWTVTRSTSLVITGISISCPAFKNIWLLSPGLASSTFSMTPAVLP